MLFFAFPASCRSVRGFTPEFIRPSWSLPINRVPKSIAQMQPCPLRADKCRESSGVSQSPRVPTWETNAQRNACATSIRETIELEVPRYNPGQNPRSGPAFPSHLIESRTITAVPTIGRATPPSAMTMKTAIFRAGQSAAHPGDAAQPPSTGLQVFGRHWPRT